MIKLLIELSLLHIEVRVSDFIHHDGKHSVISST